MIRFTAFALALIGFLTLAPPVQAVCPIIPDTDGDGVVDSLDNCSLVTNADQRDTDNDGFGNICDPDINNDGIVGIYDLATIRLAFNNNCTTCPNEDLNGDGVVGIFDFATARLYFNNNQPPGPGGTQSPVACATTEDLQTSGGVLEVPGVGTFAVDWTVMQPGETVEISIGQSTGVPSEDFQATSRPFKVLRPASAPGVTLELDTQGTEGNLYLAAHNPQEEGFLWDISRADQAVSIDWENIWLTPLLGSMCHYDVAGVKMNWARGPLDPPCASEPEDSVTIKAAVQQGLQAYEYFGCPVAGEHSVYVITGQLQGTAKSNKVYLGKHFFQQLALPQKNAATWHELFHAVHIARLEANEIDPAPTKSWVMESLATWGEAKVALFWGLENTEWVNRYADWDSGVFERGLGGATVRVDKEYYQSAPFIHHLERHAEMRVCDLLEEDPYFAVQALETQVGLLGFHYGDYVANLGGPYKNTAVTPFADITGSVTPIESKDLEAPTQVGVGRTVIWNNPASGPLCLEVTPGPDTPSFARIRVSGADHRQLAAAGVETPGRYPLPIAEPGQVVFSVSSFLGVDEGQPTKTVGLQALRDVDPSDCTSTQPACVSLDPWKFGGPEQAWFYDQYCGRPDLDYYDEQISAVNTGGSIIGCYGCDTPPCPTYRSYSISVTVPKAMEWPDRVAGAKTGGVLAGGYWPDAFTRGSGLGVCETGATGVSFSGIERQRSYSQAVRWTWECQGQEACYGGDGLPPSFN